MHSILAGAVLALSSVAGAVKPTSPTSNVPGKAFDRFAIVWLENTDYDKALGDPNLAWLAKQGITLSNYFAATHPSQPNYCASVAGDYFGMDNDDFNLFPSNVSTIIDSLEAGGVSWGEYQEDMPRAGFTGMAYPNQETGADMYVRKHNPAVNFARNTHSTQRLSQMKPLTSFYTDLKDGKLPQWMFITPNMTSDGHDTSVTTAGAWTRNFLEPLLSNKKFMQNTLVLVTFDENHSYPQQNRILSLLLGDAVPKSLHGTKDKSFYNHYSEMATVQANWGLHTLGRFDVGANVFSLVAKKTGDKVREWTEKPLLDHRYFNESYAGKKSDDGNDKVPWPAPNTKLVHHGRTVLPEVQQTWAGYDENSYYTSAVEVYDGLNPPPGYAN